MAHYSDEQWFLDLNLAENDIDSRPAEKSLSEQIDGVADCMTSMIKETEHGKAR